MNRSLSFAFSFLLTVLMSVPAIGQPGSYDQYLDHPWVDSMLSSLSGEEQLAQSLWIRINPDEGLKELLQVAEAVSAPGIGGLIFPAAPGVEMQELADYCRSLGTIAPAIALEGRWSKNYPGMLSLAAIASDSLRYLAGADLASRLREKGFTLVLDRGIDAALARGLQDHRVQVVDPEWIQSAGINEIGDLMSVLNRSDSPEPGARQVLALKYWIMQQPAGDVASKEENGTSGRSGASAFIRDLYAQSLTVLNNRGQVIPVRDLGHTRIACLALNQSQVTDFQRMAANYTVSEDYFWSPGSQNSQELGQQLAAYDLVLAALYPGSYGQETETFLRELMEKTRLVVVCLDDPSGMEGMESILSTGENRGPHGLVLAYERNPFTENLSAQLIFGGIGGSGRLPGAIGDRYPAGYGLSTPGGLRLAYGFPENAGLCSETLNHTIDSIVNRGLEVGAYPGCQVIVARKGTVVFHRAYGYHSYEKRIEVRKHDLYDLASVTKVSGPLAGLMLLEGMGKFSYRDRLGDYCGAMKGSDKADLALKDVLAHRAGLYPWIPYHEKTLKENGLYKGRFIRTDAGGKFSVQVADRLYLSNTFKEKIFKEIRRSELGEQRYLYSGLAFFLFPTVIEDLSGEPYESFLSEHIYHRLGAYELLYHPRSAFPGSRMVPTEYDSLFRKQLVQGYVHDEGAALMGAHAGNAGLFASANDLLKLMEMYRRMGTYGGEQIIQEEVLREYSSYQFPELKNRRGLGFDKPLLNEQDGTPSDYPCPGASASSFGHSGFTGTFVWADPEHEISYVFLCNRVYPTRMNNQLYDLDIRTNILQSVYDSIMDP